MDRLKLFSKHFGVDDKGPLHATHEQAREAARLMTLVYKGNIRVEIHKVVDLRLRKTEKLEELS